MRSFKHLHIFIVLIFITFSCHYHKDRLKIINKSKENLWAIPIAKDIQNNNLSYDVIGGGCELKSMDTASPITRGSIRNDIQDKKKDGNLYLLFCKYGELSFVYDHIDEIMKKKSSKYEIYSLKELDSLNWVVEYKK